MNSFRADYGSLAQERVNEFILRKGHNARTLNFEQVVAPIAQELSLSSSSSVLLAKEVSRLSVDADSVRDMKRYFIRFNKRLVSLASGSIPILTPNSYRFSTSVIIWTALELTFGALEPEGWCMAAREALRFDRFSCPNCTGNSYTI
ncbi:hypothetical protein RRF57_002437 [Xylaria bambusicola]|uniref:Uncharacterized protein n=1 Tax=Xylaria bambusicola TaxID=326684 RepID=A0AAN7Z2H6_9PEZI